VVGDIMPILLGIPGVAHAPYLHYVFTERRMQDQECECEKRYELRGVRLLPDTGIPALRIFPS
jgi:hypothetical protein